MSRLARDGTAEPVSRDQILRRERRHGKIDFRCSADHEQDWQPYPIDPYSAICDDYSRDTIRMTIRGIYSVRSTDMLDLSSCAATDICALLATVARACATAASNSRI